MAYTTVRKAVLIAGLALGASATALADETPKTVSGASASMLANTCAGCHGTNGASNGPATPSISGLSSEYFVEIMKGFKDGSVSSTIMGRIAKGYDEDEFKRMADFFTGKSFVKAKQSFDPQLAETGAKLHDRYCEKCHAEGGQSAEDDAGVLAGQWSPYLHNALADFKSGTREAPKKMAKQLETVLSKEGSAGVEALLNYYASQQ